MKKITSFTIDHNRLLRGVYVSRCDRLEHDYVTTFDIRMKEPNRETPLDQAALHTLEHLVATYLRNHPVWGDRIVYWGPMGCQTGNYLLVSGKHTPQDILPLLRNAFQFVVDFRGEIPGATPSDCGNYLLHNLALAQTEAKIYIEQVLDTITDAQLIYPTNA